MSDEIEIDLNLSKENLDKFKDDYNMGTKDDIDLVLFGILSDTEITLDFDTLEEKNNEQRTNTQRD